MSNWYNLTTAAKHTDATSSLSNLYFLPLLYLSPQTLKLHTIAKEVLKLKQQGFAHLNTKQIVLSKTACYD